MESIIGTLLMVGLISLAFIVMFRQGRNVLGCFGGILGGAAKSIGGCIGVIVVALVLSRILMTGLLGGCRPSNPPPEVSLLVDPPPPVESGTPLTLTATSSADVVQYSFTVKDETGALSALSDGEKPAMRRWHPTRPGNYVVLLTAQSSKGATASLRRNCYISPARLSPPCDEFDAADVPSGRRFGAPWFEGKVHTGVDLLLGRLDKPRVMAVSAGTVKYVGDFGAGWGKAVFIEHQYQGESLVAVYGHILPKEGMKKDGKVVRGDVVGWVDPDMNGPGNCSGPHLHFGLFKGSYDAFPRRGWGSAAPSEFPGRWVDPLPLLEAK